MSQILCAWKLHLQRKQMLWTDRRYRILFVNFIGRNRFFVYVWRKYLDCDRWCWEIADKQFWILHELTDRQNGFTSSQELAAIFSSGCCLFLQWRKLQPQLRVCFVNLMDCVNLFDTREWRAKKWWKTNRVNSIRTSGVRWPSSCQSRHVVHFSWKYSKLFEIHSIWVRTVINTRSAERAAIHTLTPKKS